MFEATRVVVNGETLALDPSGALFWPAEQTLVFADLHFEKGSWFACGGTMLPPYDTHATLHRIAALVRAYRPQRIVALGDSFHDVDGPGRLAPEPREALRQLCGVAQWLWIEGNHDPVLPPWLGGRAMAEAALGRLLFRHEPWAGRVVGEIAGHFHPCVSISRHGRTLRRRCFLTDGYRLVMPSFGAYTGGLDWRDDAFRSLFCGHCVAYALGEQRVYAVAGPAQARRRNREDDAQPKTTAMNTLESP